MSGQPIQPPAPGAVIAPTTIQPVAPTPVRVMPSIGPSGGGAPPNIAPTAPIAGVPEILTRLGFVPAGSPITQRRKRLFITSEGPPGTGKTHFLRTMPGPIGLIDFDRGSEGVLDMFKNAAGLPVNIYGEVIMRKSFEFAEFDELGKTMSPGELAKSREAYEQVKYIIERLVKSGEIKTLAVDTGGALYALAQAARFGQIAQLGEVPAAMWTSMQQEYENIFAQAYDSGCNILVTHRQGSKFKGMAGEKELKGYKVMEFVSQVHLLHQKKHVKVADPAGGFVGAMKEQIELSIKVKKCRQRIALDGHEFQIMMLGEDANGVMQSIGGRFVDVATAVFPNTSEADWI